MRIHYFHGCREIYKFTSQDLTKSALGVESSCGQARGHDGRVCERGGAGCYCGRQERVIDASRRGRSGAWAWGHHPNTSGSALTISKPERT